MSASTVKILVVDDDLSIRTLLSEILTRIGHSVRSTEDGFSALVDIRQDVPDILLSDLYMPGMSGFQLLQVVHDQFPAIQVIAMSSAFPDAVIPSGVFAHGFYEKGTNIRALLQMVECVVQAKTSRHLPERCTATPSKLRRRGIPRVGKSFIRRTAQSD